MRSTCNLDKVKGALVCDTLAREKGICKQTALHNACDVLLCSFAVAWLCDGKSQRAKNGGICKCERNRSESSWSCLVVLGQLQTILILVLICPQGFRAFMEGGELIINQNIRFQHFSGFCLLDSCLAVSVAMNCAQESKSTDRAPWNSRNFAKENLCWLNNAI